ncbi:MAG: NUDIX domain-containing protein [Oscillospiraceae bacterium]
MKLTSLCYIERGDEYLMLHRVSKKNDENHDKWIGVGGKFKACESPFDCVRREAYEETGLRLKTLCFRGIVTFVSDKWGTEYMHLFTAGGFEGDVKPCDEGVLEWIPKKKLFELNLWEGDKIFLRLLEDNHPFFSLKLLYSGENLVNAVLDDTPIK